MSIYQGNNEILWIGTKGGGLDRFDRANNTFTHYTSEADNPNSLNDNNIGAIRADTSGSLWLGTHANGLNKFDPIEEIFTRFQHDPLDLNSLNNNAILDLDIDANGFLWIGMLGGGLDRFDPTTNTFTHYVQDAGNPNALVANWIRAVTVDSNGVVWAGAEGGVSRFDSNTNTFTNFRPNIKDPNSLSSASVYTIFVDSHGIVWVGTGDGLNKLDQDTGIFTTYRTDQGPPDNTVNGILEDDQGYLWISTNKGLSKFDPKNVTFRNYDQGDGLQGNLFSWHSAFKSRSGELFFGGTNGLNSFYPDQLHDNLYQPPVYLTDFQLNNKPVPVGDDTPLSQSINFSKQITLTHDQTIFSIKFAALNYLSPDKNRYAYILEGLNNEWVYEDSKNRVATYTHINPGKYTFRVKASNNDGVWNEDGTSLAIVVIPPWWESWWFRSLALATVIGLVYSGYQWRIRSVQQQNRKLEQEIAKQNQELRSAKEAAEALSRTDPLTGVNNRRAFEEWLGHHIQLSKRYRHAMALGFIDLDNFKQLNDAMGHSKGNMALITVGKILMTAVRSSDFIGRVGGDEFCVLLPNTDLDGAKWFFERIHKQLMLETTTNSWPIGFSVGVAVFIRPAQNEDEAITIADDLMYEVKRSTKNRVVYKEITS